LQVLQKQLDLELDLYSDSKGNENKQQDSIGRIFMLSLSSQPVDHENEQGRAKVSQNNTKASFLGSSVSVLGFLFLHLRVGSLFFSFSQ